VRGLRANCSKILKYLLCTLRPKQNETKSNQRLLIESARSRLSTTSYSCRGGRRVPHTSSRARAAESREGPVVDSSRLLKFERRRRETTTRGVPTSRSTRKKIRRSGLVSQLGLTAEKVDCLPFCGGGVLCNQYWRPCHSANTDTILI